VVQGDQQPGPGAVGLRGEVGVQGVLGGGHQGVPQAGAVRPRVVWPFAGFTGGPVHPGAGGGCRAGQREEGGPEQGSVLTRTPPARSSVTARNRPR
jgi:hypothetical protein